MINWESLAIQIPILIAFIWFVLEMNSRNAKYAAMRDNQWREFFHQIVSENGKDMKRVSKILEQLVADTNKHHTEFNAAVKAMQTATGMKLKYNGKKQHGR